MYEYTTVNQGSVIQQCHLFGCWLFKIRQYIILFKTLEYSINVMIITACLQLLFNKVNYLISFERFSHSILKTSNQLIILSVKPWNCIGNRRCRTPNLSGGALLFIMCLCEQSRKNVSCSLILLIIPCTYKLSFLKINFPCL